MLKPVLTFYINTDEPEGERHVGVVVGSPYNDKGVSGVFVSPRVGGTLLVGVGDAVLDLIYKGALSEAPLPGWESLPGIQEAAA